MSIFHDIQCYPTELIEWAVRVWTRCPLQTTGYWCEYAASRIQGKSLLLCLQLTVSTCVWPIVSKCAYSNTLSLSSMFPQSLMQAWPCFRQCNWAEGRLTLRTLVSNQSRRKTLWCKTYSMQFTQLSQLAAPRRKDPRPEVWDIPICIDSYLKATKRNQTSPKWANNQGSCHHWIYTITCDHE